MSLSFLIGSKKIGGMERQVSYLARGLQERGIQVSVCLLGRPRLLDFNPQTDFGTVPTFHLWDTRYTRQFALWNLRQRLRFGDITILHCFSLLSMERGLAAADGAGFDRLAGSVRNIRFVYDESRRRRLAAACTRMKIVVVNSRAVHDSLVESAVCDPAKIRIIENGIQVTEGRRVSRNQEPGNSLVVLFAGALKELKDPVCFVRGALSLIAKIPSARFVIAGDGPLRNQIQDMIGNAGLRENFQLLGTVAPEDVPYQEADIVVSTSRHEGCSNTILESLAHGIPVVATAVGGTRDVLSGRVFGTLIDVGDHESLARALIGLAGMGRKEREKVSQEAMEYVRNRFSMQHMVDRYVNLYRDLFGHDFKRLARVQ